MLISLLSLFVHGIVTMDAFAAVILAETWNTIAVTTHHTLSTGFTVTLGVAFTLYACIMAWVVVMLFITEMTVNTIHASVHATLSEGFTGT